MTYIEHLCPLLRKVLELGETAKRSHLASCQGKYCYSHFTDESFHFPLEVSLAGSWSGWHPPLSLCPFCSPHLPLLLLTACGREQEFRDEVPLSHPRPSWPPWKASPLISWKSWGKSICFLLQRYPPEKRTEHPVQEASEWQRQRKCKTHGVWRTTWASNLEVF